MNDELWALLLGLLVTIGVWLLLREVVCWYLKINQSLKELQDINQNLVKMNQMLRRVLQSGAEGAVADVARSGGGETAVHMGAAGNNAFSEEEDMGDAIYFCPRCGATFRAKDGEIPWCGGCNLQTQFTGYFETNWYEKDREERDALVKRFQLDAAGDEKDTAQALFCPECGTRLPAGATFCSKCGNPIE